MLWKKFWQMLPLVMSLGVFGCGSDVAQDDGFDDDASELSQLEGDITIDGSSTVFPISQAVAKAFETDYPKVRVKVAVSGTGDGFKRFSRGETDISDASRPIKNSEFEAVKKAGIQFVELPVAYDGLTVVVHPKNGFVDQLTIEQLQKIFLADGAAQNWSDVNPDWPVEKMKIYAPGTASGTFDYFKEVVAGKEGSLRADMSVSEDDNVLVTGVKSEPNAIGFFGAAYYFENKGDLKAVPIINPDTGAAVLPSPEAVESGEYAPFSRPLFIYVKADSLKRPEMKKFVEFYLENAGKFAVDVGYVALPSAVYDAGKLHYQQKLTGTHFMKKDGEKREGTVPEVYKKENLVDTK